MVQAVPKEYTLASNLMMLLEDRKNADIEFLMKTYLPISLVHLGDGLTCTFIEHLGLSSSACRLSPPERAAKLLKRLESSSKPDDIIKIVHGLVEHLQAIANAERKSYVGVLEGPQLDVVAQIAQWPTYTSIEDYSFVLPSTLQKREIEVLSKSLNDSHSSLLAIREAIRRFDDVLEERIISIGRDATKSTSPRLSRLEERIHHLEDEIRYLESRREQFSGKGVKSSESKTRLKEIDADLNARRAALERDKSRKQDILDDSVGQMNRLREAQQKLRTLIKEIWPTIEQIRKGHGFITTSYPSKRKEDEDTILMLPILLAGLSRKGQLSILLISPMLLEDSRERVGMRKDFIFPFSTYSGLEQMINTLSKRANTDVSFRKTIRNASQERNILALEETRTLILEGARLLLADGLIKESGVEDLQSFLSHIPVHKPRAPTRKTRVIPLVPSDGASCDVVFNVQNDAGSPIEGAVLHISGLRLESNASGQIQISLPPSNYEGFANAKGFHEKQFDFTLDTPGNIVIPIVLSELSHEDHLGRQLDLLVEKAKRLDTIRAKLNEAFEIHGDTLLQIPAYRTILVELLSDLGLEPESWIAEAKKKRGMMKRLLKRDERDDRIRRDILRLAEESKQTGGIMLLSELLVRLDDMGWELSSDEVEATLKDMTKEGLVEGLSSLDNGARLIKFIPVALTDDPQRILTLASRNDGRLTIEEAVVELGWTEERVKNALDLLLANGVAKLQRSFSKSTQYWFPGLKSRKK